MNEPPTHEFPDGPPMPAMCSGLLGAEDVQQLFSDLAACTQISSVHVKGTEQGYSSGQPISPADAQSQLITGATRAIQVRYNYENREWTDTLMRTPHGVRLVRCQHPDSPNPTQAQQAD